jgi:hypothetical protein
MCGVALAFSVTTSLTDVSIRERRRSVSRGSFFGEDIMSEEALQTTLPCSLGRRRRPRWR